MKTLKISILTMIALCAFFFVFTGCESTEGASKEAETVVSEKVVEVIPEETKSSSSEEETIEKGETNLSANFNLVTPTAETLTGGWTLYTMEDKNAEYPISCNVTMSFAFNEETEMFGCAGINNYHGIVVIDGQTITFGPIAVTKMAGLPEDMETEDNFLRILGEVNQIGFTENIEGYEELVLGNEKTGAKLCFVR